MMPITRIICEQGSESVRDFQKFVDPGSVRPEILKVLVRGSLPVNSIFIELRHKIFSGILWHQNVWSIHRTV